MMIYKKMKKKLASVLSFIMVFGLLNFLPISSIPIVQAEDSDWPASVLTGLNMPFRPIDSLVTTQNPPDFSWPYIAGAGKYQLQLSRDAAVTNVVYDQLLTTNTHNFSVVFDPGIWYWHVRYLKPNTTTDWSSWSTVRKFRISEQYVPFTVPAIEEIMGNVSQAHPRIWTTPDTLAQFRALSLTSGKDKYDKILASVNANLHNPMPTEPTFPYPPTHVKDDDFIRAQGVLRTYVDPIVEKMEEAAFIYLITSSPEVGQNAKNLLMNLVSWNPNGSTSYVIHDQLHRAIAFKSAMAYDWLYNLLSVTERQQVLAMIKARTETMVEDLLGSSPIQQYPYNSHGWTILGYIGIISTAVLHDLPEAEQWYKAAVPAYINILPPWGGEDGSWSQGTGYWQWSSGANKEFMDVLLGSGAFNLYDKAFSRNEGMYPLYVFPHGTPKGIFGDDNSYAPGWPSVSMLNRLSQMYAKPSLKWASDAIGAKPGQGVQDYFYGDATLSSRPPVDLPNSKWFQDTGLVAMHSDLSERDRVSFYFKSSPYGSYNHSHADQNSFIINAFGESVAPESGYYDFYGSKHFLNYSKQTISANAITYDGGIGQTYDNIDADGQILGFVTTPDFDATSGDATKAYGGALTKAKRHVIYIRPSMFIVVDDLATAKPGGSSFEWLLHAEDSLDLDADGQGATVLKGQAGLKVRFYAPQQLQTRYTTDFIGVNGLSSPPEGTYAREHQVHTAFFTPKTNATKIVSTMETYNRDVDSQTVTSATYNNYMKLDFKDGSIVYVRMVDSGLIDTGIDGIQFDGAAVTVKNGAVLLVDGTKLVKNGVTLINSNKPSTIAFDGDLLSVSAQADAQISLYAPQVTRMRDNNSNLEIPSGGTVANGMNLRGVQWSSANGVMNLHVEKGQRAFKLNNAPVPHSLDPVTLQTNIDGVWGQITLSAYSDTNNVSVAWGNLNNLSGFYKVEEAPPGFSFVKYGYSHNVFLDANTPILLRGATGVLKLTRLDSGDPAQTVLFPDPNVLQSTLAMNWQEAETFTDWGGKAPNVYSTRSFLSGGVGVGGWDQTGQSLKWNFTVPKTGKYDLVLKYVAGWDLPAGTENVIRNVKIGNEMNFFYAPKTTGFGSDASQWRGLRVKLDQQLIAGPVDITMWVSLGGMNLDWIGLVEVKDDDLLPSIPGDLQLVSQTETSVNVSWNASTDNVAVKEYAVYVDGVQKFVVPNGTNHATIPGLLPGRTYKITIRAVDTSDNRSQNSNELIATTNDASAPIWGETASLQPVFILNNAVRLSWDRATDNSGAIASYSLYRQEGSQSSLVATVTGTTYDAADLQPGGTYTFTVEAKDGQGNMSVNGPSVAVTLPLIGNSFYDSFDKWSIGAAVNGNGWTYTNTNGTSVAVVPLPAGGNGLQAIDNYYDPNVYASTPTLLRANTALSGKVTVETKIMFSKVNSDVGNYTMDLIGSNKVFGQFNGFSDGGIGYQRPINGVNTYVRITPFGTYKVPQDQWMTLRFNIDFNTKTYDITVQADALINYKGALDAAGTLDSDSGTYTVTGIPFLADTATTAGIDRFRFNAISYTGKYTFDYLTMHNWVAAPQIRIAAPLSVDSNDTFPVAVGVESVTGAVYQDIALQYDTNRFKFVLAESARAGTEITNVMNDAVNGIVRIVTINADPVSGSADLLRVSFLAKSGEGTGGIGVVSARVGGSSATAIAVDGLLARAVKVLASKPVDAILSANPTLPTNANVMVTISYPTDATVKEYRLGENGAWTEYTAPVVVSVNNTVYARGTDAAGNVSNVTSLSVSNLDKVIPTATVAYSTTTSTTENVIATITPSEPITITNNAGSNSNTFYYNGSFTFDFIDAVGNQGTATAIVNNIVSKSKAKPGTPVVSDDNDYDTGLQDGKYNVTMNMWYGENGRLYQLYENDILIDTKILTDNSPNSQVTTTAINGKLNGTYRYYAKLTNAFGTTTSSTHTVTVTKAAPEKPDLSNDNWDGDGNFKVSMNMWWGTNGTTYNLYENDILIYTQSMTTNTPSAQSAMTTLANKIIGTYEYRAELVNYAGATTSAKMIVTVTK